MNRKSKTYEYIVVLKEHASYKYIDFIISIASFMHVIYVRTVLEKKFDIGGKTGLLALISVLIAAWWLFCYQQTKRGQIPFYRFGLLLCAWGWFLYPNGNFLYIIFLIAAIIEKPAKLLPEVAFDQHEIVLNTFPKQLWKWSDFNNVILKDGLLTIDCKNNKLIQRVVNEPVTKETEAEFNEFCRKQLTEKSEQITDDEEQPTLSNQPLTNN